MSGVNNTTVSVVIPAWSEASVIAQCLQSLREQTVKPTEIIIVDNNSTDATAELARAAGVIVIGQPIQGIARTRGAGFDAAKGEIIARIDADTRVAPDWIETIIHDLDDPKIVAVTGPAGYYGVPKWLSKIFRQLLITMFFDSFRHKTGVYPLFGSNMAIRRSVWQKVREKANLNDQEVHEDLDLGLLAAKQGTILYDPNLNVMISSRAVWHPIGLIKRNTKNKRTIAGHEKS